MRSGAEGSSGTGELTANEGQPTTMINSNYGVPELQTHRPTFRFAPETKRPTSDSPLRLSAPL